MTEKAISPLRRRLIEDMAIRRLSPKTQLHYIRHVKRFADFLGRSADKATAEEVVGWNPHLLEEQLRGVLGLAADLIELRTAGMGHGTKPLSR